MPLLLLAISVLEKYYQQEIYHSENQILEICMGCIYIYIDIDIEIDIDIRYVNYI